MASALLSSTDSNSGASRPTSRPDFTVGFGLDIPEEEEETEEQDPREDDRDLLLGPSGNANDTRRGGLLPFERLQRF